MTDKELLELAAKAANVRLNVIMNGDCGELVKRKDHETGAGVWNPLTDDGDALRLAVKLDLLIQVKYTKYMEVAEFVKDPYSATRRAIVRAAAEIGRSMK